MKNRFRPKLITKPNSLQFVYGGFESLSNLVLWLMPLLFGVLALYVGYDVMTDSVDRYIRLGVMVYGAGMILYSIIKAPKRLSRIANGSAALTFTKQGITRKTITMENEQHYQWSDIDKLVITPNLLLNSSNHNSHHTYNLLVLFDNDAYSERMNVERKNEGKKSIKINGLWHTTQHHFELTLDNTVFFRQPFKERDLNELQRNIKAYTDPILTENFELIVHPVSSSMDNHDID